MFFQNPFTADFNGSWVLGDRQHIPNFKCSGNKGRGDEAVYAWAAEPYDLTGVATLTLTFALNMDAFKNWSTLAVNLTPAGDDGYVIGSATALNLATKLNASAAFSSYFYASVQNGRLHIKQKFPVTQMKFYVNNTGAETKIKFNARAGVAELPSYFVRHTVGETYRFDFSDSLNCLVQLDETDPVDGAVIDSAVDARGNSLNLDSSSPKADWEFLKGQSGIFNFQKIYVDDSDRILYIIEYPAGAKAGDLARLTEYAYTGQNKNPDQITETPYTLAAGDLITPPYEDLSCPVD